MEKLKGEQRTARMLVGGTVFEYEEIKQIYDEAQH